MTEDYFLSPEYYKDIYLIKEQEFNDLLKGNCLTKLELKSFEKSYQTLLLLSGDIALNPGPVLHPCPKCKDNVGRNSILCTQCNLWIHRYCEGLSNAELISLSKSADFFKCLVVYIHMDIKWDWVVEFQNV